MAEPDQVGTGGSPTPGGSPAVILTFDNLGEAAELERGTWPEDRPVGAHPSVTVALPRLLDELDANGLRATFFVEGINCELNPDALRTIAARGHELGLHGWRHETWDGVEPGRESELLQRSKAAFDRLGLCPVAFRPPGGELHPETPGRLRDLGYRWVSPLGDRFEVDERGLGWVGFEWSRVDAYLRMASFASLREARGDPAEPLPAMTAGQRLVGELAGADGPRTVILHPHLLVDDAWWHEAQRLLRWLARWRDSGEVSVLTGTELTERLAQAR